MLARKTDRVQVYIRTKPTCQFADDLLELDTSTNTIKVHLPPHPTRGHIDNQQLDFSFTVDGLLHNVSQEEVFESCAEDLVSRALDGYSGTVLAFGQTGAGKTYSISGPGQSYRHRGILPRLIHNLYQEIDERYEQDVSIKASYLEIYNESLYDLLGGLNDSVSDKLVVTEECGVVGVKGLSVRQSRNEEEALNFLFEGETNRCIGEHMLNRVSSRSHCIFTLYIESRSRTHSTSRYFQSKLNIVDLAGSERLKKTGSGGNVQKEALYINKSLTFLEQVVVALADTKRDHVPYRQSKLTHFLKDSIGGSCQTILIANIWTEEEHIDETLSTLRFSQRMMCVRSTPQQAIQQDPYIMLEEYEKEIKHLRQELKLQDALSGRRDVSYEPMSEVQIKLMQGQIQKYIEGSIPELDIQNLRQVKELLSHFRTLVRSTSTSNSRTPTTVNTAPSVEIAAASTSSAVNTAHVHSTHTGRKEKSDRSGSRGGRTTQNLSRPAPQPVPEEKGKERDTQVGDIDSQGFGIGVVPSHLQGAHSNPITAATKKKSVPSNQQGPGVHEGGRDQDTSCSSLGSLRENNDAPPSKQEAFEEFKKERGRGINKVLVENKSILHEKRKILHEQTLALNDIKKEIDSHKHFLETNKLHERRETVLEQEEFENIHRLTELKGKYKELMNQIQVVRPQTEHCQVMVDQSRQKMLNEFETWYLQIFPLQNNTMVESDTVSTEQPTKQSKATDEYELERFERLKDEINRNNPESTAFYDAMYKTQLRKRSNSLKKPTSTTLSPNVRNKPPSTLAVN
ncbi:Kinesin-like protein KIF9 [Oopsacas minuta]|uniref:Kinesin-like protein n=1 Tax=Oopsacas minuta TaxID=111878 RepID=A0AAV7JXK8_9METZ|nr:Kinesin-like protein KIF9 [Oopsacas minuta]